MVADARTLSDVITELLSHPLEEFRIVGARIEQEAKKALPTLLAHARPNSFQEEVLRTTARAAVEFGASQRIRGPGSPRVELLAFDPELDAKLLASLWFEASDQPFTALLERSRRMTEAERERSMRRVLDARGDRDPLPLAIEGAQPFDFELLVDFGAYRDIGRHRKGFQQQQRLTTAHGYVVPPLIEAAGATERFRAVLDAVAELQPVVAAEHPHAAGYVTPFAFLQRVRIVFEPRQCAYFIELRSGPEGHFAYRQAALDMLSRIESVSPLFASFIRAQRGGAFLGRMAGEQGADDRRRQRMERAGDA
ncbi:MAG: FAD-dependent thymidylate synthase [Planctomycetes bacterium]|nr:FAD-dependent thymidylate synthase [Planctomycetota bacterium]